MGRVVVFKCADMSILSCARNQQFLQRLPSLNGTGAQTSSDGDSEPERGLGRQSTQEPLIGLQQQFKCSHKADSQAATAAVADIPSDSLFSCVPIKRLIVAMPFPFAVDLANYSITRNVQDDPFAAHNKGTELNLDKPDSRASPFFATSLILKSWLSHTHFI